MTSSCRHPVTPFYNDHISSADTSSSASGKFIPRQRQLFDYWGTMEKGIRVGNAATTEWGKDGGFDGS